MPFITLLIMFCAGFDYCFGVCTKYAQVRWRIWDIIIRKSFLRISPTRLETLWLRAWFETYHIKHQFYWRKAFVRAWKEDRATYLPRICDKKLMIEFGKTQAKLAGAVQQSMNGSGLAVLDAATTFQRLFGRDHATRRTIASWFSPPDITRAHLKPHQPPPNPDLNATADCIVTKEYFSQTCCTDTYNQLVKKKTLLKDVNDIYEQLSIDAQVSWIPQSVCSFSKANYVDRKL
jgi:hypothetical protein